MLKMVGVSKVYVTADIETHALRDFDIDVSPGEFVAVTGPSGSGKTTFLTIAGLMDSFTCGTLQIDGVDTQGMNDRSRSRVRNEKIGFVFQAFNLISDLNVIDNIEAPLRYRGLPSAKRRDLARRSLDRVGLMARARHFPSQLSGGQQQRVAIARALAGNPALILADEPTGNLDTQTARDVVSLLEEIHSAGSTIVMVTHNQELAARAERVVHIVDGRSLSV